MNMDLFEGYILAGGKSSRMGSDKAFLTLDGETFLDRAMQALAPNCSSVKIVINRNQAHFIEKLPAEIPHIFDSFENRGALGGIHAALKDCRTKLAIILAVDLPFVTADAIEKLTQIALASNKFLAFVPRQADNRFQPLCAVYRANYCLPTLENLLKASESASVQDFLDLICPKFFNSNHLSEKENLLFNVNQISDYEKLEHPSEIT